MRTVYVFALLGFAFLAELLAGRLDLPFFLAALVVYYVSLTTSLGIGFAVSIGFGILLDLAYGRDLPVTAAILDMLSDEFGFDVGRAAQARNGGASPHRP